MIAVFLWKRESIVSNGTNVTSWIGNFFLSSVFTSMFYGWNKSTRTHLFWECSDPCSDTPLSPERTLSCETRGSGLGEALLSLIWSQSNPTLGMGGTSSASLANWSARQCGQGMILLTRNFPVKRTKAIPVWYKSQVSHFHTIESSTMDKEDGPISTSQWVFMRYSNSGFHSTNHMHSESVELRHRWKQKKKLSVFKIPKPFREVFANFG